MTRPENGSMRFGDDWAGVFIRGDNALVYADYIDESELLLEMPALSHLRDMLRSCANNTSEQNLKSWDDCQIGKPEKPVIIPLSRLREVWKDIHAKAKDWETDVSTEWFYKVEHLKHTAQIEQLRKERDELQNRWDTIRGYNKGWSPEFIAEIDALEEKYSDELNHDELVSIGYMAQQWGFFETAAMKWQAEKMQYENRIAELQEKVDLSQTQVVPLR